MLTNLFIGNSNTFVRAGLMVTPRGYGLKYRLADGAARPGGTARVSLSSGLEGWRRALVETALREGIKAAARALDANPSQVLDALSEAQIAPWRVVAHQAPEALLEEALGWRNPTLYMRSPGGGSADLSLADARVKADPDSIAIEDSGWRVALPRAATAGAYRVGLPSGEEACGREWWPSERALPANLHPVASWAQAGEAAAYLWVTRETIHPELRVRLGRRLVVYRLDVSA